MNPFNLINFMQSIPQPIGHRSTVRIEEVEDDSTTPANSVVDDIEIPPLLTQNELEHMRYTHMEDVD